MKKTILLLISMLSFSGSYAYNYFEIVSHYNNNKIIGYEIGPIDVGFYTPFFTIKPMSIYGQPMLFEIDLGIVKKLYLENGEEVSLYGELFG